MLFWQLPLIGPSFHSCFSSSIIHTQILLLLSFNVLVCCLIIPYQYLSRIITKVYIQSRVACTFTFLQIQSIRYSMHNDTNSACLQKLEVRCATQIALFSRLFSCTYLKYGAPLTVREKEKKTNMFP